MLTINGLKYAKNDEEFVDTLFHGEGGTASGYYSKQRGGIQLFNMQKELFAFIVNRPGEQVFAVSAHSTPEGARYMFSTTSKDEDTLGLNRVRYSEQADYLKAAIAGA